MAEIERQRQVEATTRQEEVQAHLAKARQASLAVSCMSNMRQVGTALQAYIIQNKGYLPHGNANHGETENCRAIST